MEIITIYKANDGTQFDNEFDCELYELNKLIMENPLKIYGDHNKRLKNPASSSTWGDAKRVIINTEKELETMKAIQEWTGYYYDINSIGTWKWSNIRETFIKV